MGQRAWSHPVKGGPMLARIPLGRFAECEDIASVVCFLLTEGAAMLNGLALRIDGGFLVDLKFTRENTAAMARFVWAISLLRW
jgi:L-xylulose reductase